MIHKEPPPIVHQIKETLTQEQEQFARNTIKLMQFILDSGKCYTFGEAWRSPQQAAIYAKEGLGIKNSLHCERLAIDLNLFDKNGKWLKKYEDYEEAGKYWESLHPLNRWGGRFHPLVDLDHFEMQVMK